MDNQELLKNTSKWLVLMGIDGEPNHYTKNYLQWRKHKENLQIKGTVENLIYTFYNGKPNYRKLTQEVEHILNLNKNYDKASIVEMFVRKKQRGITTILRPSKEEIANSYDDFGFVNLNPDLSSGEYEKLFNDFCKKTNKTFPSVAKKKEALEVLMINTQHWDYALLEDYLHTKYAEWKRNNKK